MTSVRAFFGMICLLALACEDDFEPTIQKQTRLLAGGAGVGSKKWKLVAGGSESPRRPYTPIIVSSCYGDNIYSFSNNVDQKYQITEGASKCRSFDTNITEEGSWALALDGNSIIFHASEFRQSQFTFGYVRARIDELTKSSLRISYDVRFLTYTLVFEALPCESLNCIW